MCSSDLAGQSGTAIAASKVVTRAPKQSSTAVTATSPHAMTCDQLKGRLFIGELAKMLCCTETDLN